MFHVPDQKTTLKAYHQPPTYHKRHREGKAERQIEEKRGKERNTVKGDWWPQSGYIFVLPGSCDALGSTGPTCNGVTATKTDSSLAHFTT